jgi:hypothetical protein
VAHHHARSGDRRSSGGLCEGVAADPRRSRRLSRFARAAELLLKAATSAPFEGRPMYAALRAIPIPDDVVARSSMQLPCCASTVATGTSRP